MNSSQKSVYDFQVQKIDGSSIRLGDFEGQVLLVVNVASKCGLTPQYEALEKIYEKYQADGFQVLGFPANEFMGQEPGTDAEIEKFCTMNFGVKFPMFSKIVVKGEGQHPLYEYLTRVQPAPLQKEGGQLEQKLQEKGLGPVEPNDIRWNFEKFIVNRRGQVVARFSPDVTPDDPMIIEAIERELKA